MRPGTLLDPWTQMIVPSLPALLTYASWQPVSYVCPLLCSIFVDTFKNNQVFVIAPWALDQVRVENFLPAVQTLNITSAWKRLSNLFPAFAGVGVYSLLKELVLGLSPVALTLAILVLSWAALVHVRQVSLSSFNIGLKLVVLQQLRSSR